jgi:hypothetical protein
MGHPTIIATIYDRLETLDEWKRPALLEHLDECISGKNRLPEILSSGNSIKFTLASDGGATETIMAPLAGNSQSIARHCGNAKVLHLVWNLHSVCNQAPSKPSHADLSWLCSLCKRVFSISTPSSTKKSHSTSASCDRKSLIQCVLHRPWVNPSQRLASDFGLKSGILNIIVSLSISFHCLHVRIHQHDDAEVHLLPWEAQMNVHADALATDSLNNCAEPSKIAPFIPASQAGLTINGKTIT